MAGMRLEKSRMFVGIVLGVIASCLVVPTSAAAYNPEFCEVLNKFNADKKISDPAVRTRYEGEYGKADDSDHLRTWNVETACENFLVAVPLWADVSPPVLAHQGGEVFKDAMGSTWTFHVNGDGAVVGVTMVSADGTVTEMTRLGDPRTFD